MYDVNNYSFSTAPHRSPADVMNRARENGFYFGNNEWANLGQGAPELGSYGLFSEKGKPVSCRELFRCRPLCSPATFPHLPKFRMITFSRATFMYPDLTPFFQERFRALQNVQRM